MRAYTLSSHLGATGSAGVRIPRSPAQPPYTSARIDGETEISQIYPCISEEYIQENRYRCQSGKIEKSHLCPCLMEYIVDKSYAKQHNKPYTKHEKPQYERLFKGIEGRSIVIPLPYLRHEALQSVIESSGKHEQPRKDDREQTVNIIGPYQPELLAADGAGHSPKKKDSQHNKKSKGTTAAEPVESLLYGVDGNNVFQ